MSERMSERMSEKLSEERLASFEVGSGHFSHVAELVAECRRARAAEDFERQRGDENFEALERVEAVRDAMRAQLEEAKGKIVADTQLMIDANHQLMSAGISLDTLKAQLAEARADWHSDLLLAKEWRDKLEAQLAEAKAVNKGWFYTQTDYTDLLAQLAALIKAADALAEAVAAFLILRLEARGRESDAVPIAKAIQLGEAALAAYQKARGGL